MLNFFLVFLCCLDLAHAFELTQYPLDLAENSHCPNASYAATGLGRCRFMRSVAYAFAMGDWAFGSYRTAVDAGCADKKLVAISQRRAVDHWQCSRALFHAAGDTAGGPLMVGHCAEHVLGNGFGASLCRMAAPPTQRARTVSCSRDFQDDNLFFCTDWRCFRNDPDV